MRPIVQYAERWSSQYRWKNLIKGRPDPNKSNSFLRHAYSVKQRWHKTLVDFCHVPVPRQVPTKVERGKRSFAGSPEQRCCLTDKQQKHEWAFTRLKNLWCDHPALNNQTAYVDRKGQVHNILPRQTHKLSEVYLEIRLAWHPSQKLRNGTQL